MRTIVLDNEPVQALLDPHHPKHRTVMAHIVGVAHRRRKRADVELVVPTSVRVEAGWSRTDPRAASANRLPIRDVVLDSEIANLAAERAASAGLSVTDSHVGAVALRASSTNEIVVLTSDPADIERAASGRTVRVIRI